MAARQSKKRKGRANPNNRERTVTTFTEDPNTSFLVPLSSDDPPPFAMHYHHPFFPPALPPGKNDLEILENLKATIRNSQHEFYRAVPQPRALAALYNGPIHTQHQDYDDEPPANTTEPDTSPPHIGAEPQDNAPAVQPDADDTQPPPDTSVDVAGEYPQHPDPDPDPAPADDKPAPMDDSPPPPDNAWERDDTQDARPHSRPPESPFPPTDDDRRLPDRDRDRDRPVDRDRDWDRDRDRDRPFRRREFVGHSYGRSHAPRPPPELRHYEPSYGPDYVPPPRRYDDDRRPALRNPPPDDRFKPPPLDDRRPPFDDRRPSLADRRPLPGSDSRAPPTSSEDRSRAASDAIPLARPTTDDDRGAPLADDPPRPNVPLEERLSQPAPTPSLQDRLSQPAPRPDMAVAPTLEERLSVGPVPPRAYPRAPSVARDDLRAPPLKDDHGRFSDFRPNRPFSRERPDGPPPAVSSYRPDLDRGFADRDERDRRDRDDVDTPPARFGDGFSRPGPPPPRRYSPPHLFDRDRDRGRSVYPPRSPPPPFRGEGVYEDGERRYTAEREREYDARRWWDDDKRGPAPPGGSWRAHDRPPLMDRDRDRFERERDRDVRSDREREVGWQWEDRERRFAPPPPPPPAGRMDAGRSLSARLTDPYPGGDERGYAPPPPAREFERGRYDDPPAFSRVRPRSPSPPRRGLGGDEMRPPPMKRLRDDGPYGGYSPPRRGEYVPGPPPSSAATTGSVIASVGVGGVRSAGTRTPPVSAPPPSSTSASGGFYDREREREREREYGRGEWYERRRSPPPPPPMGRLGYGRGVRDDRRYGLPPPRTS